MKILLVGNYYPEHQGGIETVTENLARGYRRLGHQVRWLAAEPRGFPHTGHPDDRPMRAWNLTEDHLGFPYPLLAPGAHTGIVREVSACDVLHVHDCLYPASVTAWLAARRTRTPLLLTQHVGPVPYRRRALRLLQQGAYRTIGRAVLSSSDQVTFISPTVRAWFSRFCSFRQPPPVVSNGVDTARFHPVDPQSRAQLRAAAGVAPQTPLLLFVGRFVEKKGLGLLREVVARHPDWSWVFIGRPGGTDPTSWGLPNLRILEPMPPLTLQRWYAAADLLVLPSTGEGFPVVVQESMACGTPALVSVEVAEALSGATVGLFSTRRTPDAIADAIRQALAGLQESSTMRGRTAAFALREWNWDARAAQYAGLLTTLRGWNAGQEAPEQPVALP